MRRRTFIGTGTGGGGTVTGTGTIGQFAKFTSSSAIGDGGSIADGQVAFGDGTSIAGFGNWDGSRLLPNVFQISAPQNVSVSGGTNGSLIYGDYFIYVSALDADGIETPVSAQAAVTIDEGDNGTGSFEVEADAVTDAVTYRVYVRPTRIASNEVTCRYFESSELPLEVTAYNGTIGNPPAYITEVPLDVNSLVPTFSQLRSQGDITLEGGFHLYSFRKHINTGPVIERPSKLQSLIFSDWNDGNTVKIAGLGLDVGSAESVELHGQSITIGDGLSEILVASSTATNNGIVQINPSGAGFTQNVLGYFDSTALTITLGTQEAAGASNQIILTPVSGGNSFSPVIGVDAVPSLGASAAPWSALHVKPITQYGSTSGSITHSVPATITSYEIKWPSAQGTAGQFLKIASVTGSVITMEWGT